MDAESRDPRRIRTLAVTADDIVSALEARIQQGRDVVLRVTPPFSGRMRARIHVATGEYEDGPEPLHVEPSTFVDDAAPSYPRPADTEDQIRTDPAVEYTVERHHDRHEEAVAAWRRRVRDHFVTAATVETPHGPHEVSVTVLGSETDD